MTLLKLYHRCWLSCLLLLLIDEVSPQEIEAAVGDSVVLPCLNGDPALQNKLLVFWRFRYNSTVYDIINSRASFELQDESFRGRAESFPDQWTHGNFSIKLNNVTQADAGTYTCYIPAINANRELDLTVKDLPERPDSRTNDDSGNGDLKSRPDCWLLILALLLGSPLLSA